LAGRWDWRSVRSRGWRESGRGGRGAGGRGGGRFFYVPISESGAREEVERLGAAAPDSFLLLTPTARFCTERVRREARRQGGAQMALAGMLRLTAAGALEIAAPEERAVRAVLNDLERPLAARPGWERAVARLDRKLEAMAKMCPAPAPDKEEDEKLPADVARQAFALVEKLDMEQGIRKAPVLTVFRLYCIKGMSAEQAARECRCSKATIINRLDMILRKTGVHPDKLRAYSAHFERVEEKVSDSRAREIYRKGLTDDTEDEDSED